MKKILLVTVMLVSVICGYAQRKVERIVEWDGFTWYKIKEDGLVGVGDAKGNMLIDVKYDSIYTTRMYLGSNRKEVHYNIRKNGFEGICDSNGNELLPPQKYESVERHMGNDQISYYQIRKNGFGGICDANGKEIIPPTKYHRVLRDADYVGSDKYEITYRVKLDDYEGVCNKYGLEIFPPNKYEYVDRDGDAKDGFYYVVKANGFAGICDINGTEILKPEKYVGVSLEGDAKNGFWYEVRNKDGLYGVCDVYGIEVIPPTKYSYIRRENAIAGRSNYSNKETHFYYRVEVGDSVGICDLNGFEVFSPSMYEDVIMYFDEQKEESYFEVETNDGIVGICNGKGDVVIPPTRYTSIYRQIDRTSDNPEIYYLVKVGNYMGVCDKLGKEIIPPTKYGSIERRIAKVKLSVSGPEWEVGYYYRTEINGKYGVCTADGKEIVPCMYESIIYYKISWDSDVHSFCGQRTSTGDVKPLYVDIEGNRIPGGNNNDASSSSSSSTSSNQSSSSSGSGYVPQIIYTGGNIDVGTGGVIGGASTSTPTTRTCSVCQGTGKDLTPSTVAQYGQTTYQYCDICKSNGTPHYHKVCPSCLGRKTVNY